MTSIAKKQPRSHVSNHIKESTGRKAFRVVNAVLLTALALICLLPFVSVIAISFSNRPTDLKLAIRTARFEEKDKQRHENPA